MKVDIRTITPDVAVELLKLNKENRKANRVTVLFYADQMLKGNWKLTHQGIAISEDNDRLLDGQHRLMAVVESGITVQMVVSSGLDSDTFACIDNGKARNTADVLHTQLVNNAAHVGTMIRKAYALHIGKGTERGRVSMKFSSQDIYNEYITKPDYYQKVVAKSKKLYGKLRILSASDIASHIVYLNVNMHHEYDYVVSFFEQLIGEVPIVNKTIEVLRYKLMNDMASRLKMSKKDKFNLLNKTWNNYLDGKSTSRLAYQKEKDGDVKLK